MTWKTKTKVVSSWCSLAALLGSVALVSACGDDSGAMVDAGVDAGDESDAGDAGGDAGGLCTEFTPEYCPREYPMSPVAINTICEVFADMFCRANGNCCERPDEIYETFTMCTSDQISRCMDPARGFEHSTSLMNSLLDYNSAALGEQRARLGTMSDTCAPVSFGDAIEASMRGRVATGGACTVSAECMDGASCRMGTDAMTCQPNLGIGGPCDTQADCAPGELQCVAGACAARLAIGETCTEDEACESLLCVDGSCAEVDGGLVYCVRQGEPGRAFER